MSRTHDTIIAALVNKLGGDVSITYNEFRKVEADLELIEYDHPELMKMRFTAKPPAAPPTIMEVLNSHPEWEWSIRRRSVICKGCGWAEVLGMEDIAADHFLQHQADMIADAGFSL